MGGQSIYDQSKVKLLRVVLDKKLIYKKYIIKVLKRGITAVLGLKKLRNLCPESTQQLFKFTIAPIVDYALRIWSLGIEISTLKKLGQIQRIRVQAIIEAFCSVAL